MSPFPPLQQQSKLCTWWEVVGEGPGVVDPEVKSSIKERKGVHSPTLPHHHRPHPPLTPLPKAFSA